MIMISRWVQRRYSRSTIPMKRSTHRVAPRIASHRIASRQCMGPLFLRGRRTSTNERTTDRSRWGGETKCGDGNRRATGCREGGGGPKRRGVPAQWHTHVIEQRGDRKCCPSLHHTPRTKAQRRGTLRCNGAAAVTLRVAAARLPFLPSFLTHFFDPSQNLKLIATD